jgi:hypothetical protein
MAASMKMGAFWDVAPCSLDVLDQGWANYGPRAKYGPLRGPRKISKMLKKMVSKNI